MDTALYMRMSTDKQENSIESQEQVLVSYAKKNNLIIREKYIDEGISGKKAIKRPAFMRMMEDSEKDCFQAVLVYDLSRFARNLEESIVYKAALKRNGVQLISATEPTLDEESTLISDAMLGALNELYVCKLSKAVKRGMAFSAQKGKYQVPPPYGYIKQNGIMKVVEEEAETVNIICKLFIEKPYWNYVAVRANELGLRTRKGMLWSSRDIKRMLNNWAYIGYVNHNNERYKADHEKIIDEAVFRKIQRLIEEKPLSAKARPEKEYSHWLSGILKCGSCGGGMNCITPKRGSRFFRCRSNAMGKCKSSNFILEKDIEKIAIAVLKELALTNQSDIIFIERLKESKEKSLLESSLKRARARMERYKSAYYSEVDSLYEYSKNKEACLEEQRKIESKLKIFEEAENKQGGARALTYSPLELIGFLEEDRFDTGQKSMAVKSILSRLVYNRELNELTVHYFL